MIRNRVLSLLLPALAAAVPTAAQAVDQGTFRVYVGDREVGNETFSINQTGSGAVAVTMATGRVDLRLPAGSLTLVPRLRAQGVGADPVQYQVDVSGDAPERIVGTIAG